MSYNKIIMEYLKIWEGDYIHYNRGEKSITSAYGIYKYENPKAQIFRWYKQLRKQHGIGSLKYKENRKILNHVIASDKNLREMQKDLAFNFYSKNYINSKVAYMLPSYATLTYFSISVNGGIRRGNKAIQYAISRYGGKKIQIDGKIGQKTLEALYRITNAKYFNGKKFNNLMARYLKRYYKKLINNNPQKYKRYARGWYRRADALYV